MNTDFENFAAVRAVDFDCTTGYVYWSDANAIGRCLANGTSFSGTFMTGEPYYVYMTPTMHDVLLRCRRFRI